MSSETEAPSADLLSTSVLDLPPFSLPATTSDNPDAVSPTYTAPVASTPDSTPAPPPAPNTEPPSLSLAIVSTWSTTIWSQRLPALFASIAINFGLPFINGVMLGFGELFARNVLAVRLGWGAPFAGRSGVGATGGREANTASLGLVAAGGRSSRVGKNGSAAERTAAGVVFGEGEVLSGVRRAAVV